MRTLGIDLSAQDRKTAACGIVWVDGRAVVEEPIIGTAKDDDVAWLADLITNATLTGIDAPFGWPDAMVEAVSDWAQDRPWTSSEKEGLRYRLTDLRVRDITKRSPLSVSSDRIAATAWRCARLLDAVRTDHPIRRSGEDGVVEVYPGAALTIWGFERAGYKTGARTERRASERRARAALLDDFLRRAPWMDLGAATDACTESDDALDAVIAALVARAAALNHTIGPEPGEMERARREGWIHLPRPGSLEQLAEGGPGPDGS